MKELKDYLFYETELGKLYCGKNEEIIPLLNVVNIVITDPPYNVGFEYDCIDDNKSDEDYVKLLKPTMSINCNKIIMQGNRNLSFMIKNFSDYKKIGIWDKGEGAITRGGNIFGFTIWEPIFFYGDFKSNLRHNDMFRFSAGGEHGIDHPCPKPSRLMRELIIKFTSINDTILDSFCGSGSTLLACEKLNRKWIGIDISERYCETTKKRIEVEANQIKMVFA